MSEGEEGSDFLADIFEDSGRRGARQHAPDGAESLSPTVRRRRLIRPHLRRKERDTELSQQLCAVEAKLRRSLLEQVPRKKDDGAQYPKWPEPEPVPLKHPLVQARRRRTREAQEARQAKRTMAQAAHEAALEERAAAAAVRSQQGNKKPAIRRPGLQAFAKREGMEDGDFPWLPSAPAGFDGQSNKVTWWAIEGFLKNMKGGGGNDDADDDGDDD